MSEHIPVSILMPVKNTEKYLEECIDSIIKQSFTDWELILVNDHSTDKSEEIMKRYVEEDERITLFNSPGKGIIPAVEHAFAEAKGKYITKMDSDDIMIPGKIEELYSIVSSHPENSVATGAVEYFASGKDLNDGYRYYADRINSHLPTNSQYKDIYYECPIPSPVWMTSRENLLNVGGIITGVYPEDYDLVFRFYAHNCPVISSDKIIHRWRDHTTRATRQQIQYYERTFFPLKVSYFKKLDYNPEKELILWGTGSKGKPLAKILSRQGLKFQWTCNNPRKWNKHIYGIKIEEPRNYSPDQVQIITAVSSPEERSELQENLKKQGFKINYSLFIFC